MTAHTALHAPQAHVAKTDEASPFSALLETVAPKTDKTKPKDKAASDDADDAKDAKTDTVKVDGKTDAKADAPADKSDKADKPEKDADKPATADATQVAADAPAQPAAVPPALVAVAAAPAKDETGNDIEAVTGAANGAAPAPQNDKTAAAPQDGDQADDAATDAAAPQDIKGAAQGAPRKPATDAKNGKPDDIKADSAKSDGSKPDSATADNAKPDAAQPVAAADAPKPAQATATNMAVHDITAPQAPQANAPGVTQHVQVAPQAQAQVPTPNMPALAIEISAKSQSGAKQFDIRLDPPELGRVEVRLSIDATGKASAHLSADQPQTLDLLQKDSTSLMRALRDAGLDVSQDGLNFSLRQQAQDGGAQQGGGRGSARNFSLTATTSLEATATSAAYRRPADGRVDISV
jgi:flagellar hook-length control protein FliK